MRNGETEEVANVQIDWSKNSEEDQQLCYEIAKRACELLRTYAKGEHADTQSLVMDVEAANIVCPMRLEELLEADDENFAHDVFGIERHINRETGQLDNCFLPRFAKPEGYEDDENTRD